MHLAMRYRVCLLRWAKFAVLGDIETLFNRKFSISLM